MTMRLLEVQLFLRFLKMPISSPNIMLTAIDADVIKTYVSLNMGIGLIAEMAFDATTDHPMVSRDVSHLFPLSTTYIGN
jgi:LysR family cys regulon transcriptional activator